MIKVWNSFTFVSVNWLSFWWMGNMYIVQENTLKKLWFNFPLTYISRPNAGTIWRRGCADECIHEGDVTYFVKHPVLPSFSCGRSSNSFFSVEYGRRSSFCILHRFNKQRWHSYRWQSLLGGVSHDRQLAHTGGTAFPDAVNARWPRPKHRDRPSYPWVWADSVGGHSSSATPGKIYR